MQQRIIAVTGASRGLGAALSMELVRRGHQVIACARAQEKLEKLDDQVRATFGRGLTLVPLDVTDFDAIDRLGGALFEQFGRLDGFVANAAVLNGLMPLTHFTPRVFERHLATNVTANWRFMRSFEPLLRQSPAGRAVFVTSSAARAPRAFWGHYAASKAALEAMAFAWADELEQTSIRVSVFNPGRMRTAMRAEAFPGEDPASLPTPEQIAPELADLVEVQAIGARTVLAASTVKQAS